MSIGARIFLLIITLAMVGTLSSRVYHYKDELYFSEVRYGKLAIEYENHLYLEYVKTICGIEAPTLSGTDNRAGTAKDMACMIGVREKAKKEVEAIKK